MAGIQLVHVPYKGSGQALIDLLGGQIDLTYASAISATPHIKSGAVRALAVTTLKRSPLFPDIPSIAESGVPGYEVSSWYGLVAPKGTPPAVIDRLHREIATILATPEAVATLAKNGARAGGGHAGRVARQDARRDRPLAARRARFGHQDGVNGPRAGRFHAAFGCSPPRSRAMYAARSRASSPAPSISADLRRRRNCRPIT